MSNPKIEQLAELYQSCINGTVTAAEAVPEDARMRQAAEGKAHPLWLLGHLAFSFDTFVNVLTLGGAPACPGNYAALFAPAQAGGGPVSADASTYPSWDELLENYKKAGQAIIDGINKCTDDELTGDVKGSPPDAFKSFFPNLGSPLSGMTLHDSYHRGQIGLLANLPK